MFLTRPDVAYKNSYLEAIREAHAESRHMELSCSSLRRHFHGYVQDLLARADIERIPPGWVPESWFWLIDDDIYIGTTRIRHYLDEGLRRYGGNIGYEIRPAKRRQGYGTAILRLALVEAGKLGITRALVTCAHDNIGSRKIIEANGGVFEGEDEVRVMGETICERRYWIDIPATT